MHTVSQFSNLPPKTISFNIIIHLFHKQEPPLSRRQWRQTALLSGPYPPCRLLGTVTLKSVCDLIYHIDAKSIRGRLGFPARSASNNRESVVAWGMVIGYSRYRDERKHAISD